MDPNGFNKGMTSPICYDRVSEIKKSRQSLMDAGGKVIQEVRDIGGGKLIASMQGPEGNLIRLTQMPGG